jgi:nitroreductase
MNKQAQTRLPIHELLAERWSPRAFSEKLVEPDKLLKLFEAARWSASCGNEQPWRFMAGIKDRDETWTKIFRCLDEGNQVWCQRAPVLLLLSSKMTFISDNSYNQWHLYDLGQTAAYISVQAFEDGLFVHQMAGFDKDIARQAFNIPADYEIATTMAIGYRDNPSVLPEKLQKREMAERRRRELTELVFTETWGKAMEWSV